MTIPKSAVTRVPGFRAVGVTCGLKQSGNPDLALILASHPCTAAAVFTTNVFKAAPVLYDLALMERTGGKLQAVLINAGNANAVTGGQGLADAEQMARWAETACNLPADSVFVMSTGVIGQKMPMDKLETGIRIASETILTEAGRYGSAVAEAIMTTDLVPKEVFVQVVVGEKRVHLGGMAKGSGMIHPNLATMLAVIVTDAAIEPAALTAALKQAVACTFNRITVDGDTSTNDTVLILASGEAGHALISDSQSPGFAPFVTALTDVCSGLAKAVVRDGEGATKLIEITIRGAASEVEAEAAAKTIATSPLMKTALFGNDPNWGRALAAIGRSGARVDPAQVSLRLGDFQLVAQGEPLPFDMIAAHHWLAETDEVKLVADLGVGQAEATVWTCDLSYKYVEINAEYHT
ncbi:MAG: bifunctional glutamate N-acetyltransferase/amino-acid acetyltransferase ArgJ [Anaerolineales bacterium]|nr:bifunctional glutamate N-acetyltransferase/amino-acid acetyltransferase ArgJ [Anaerolineales bacterium]